MWILRLGLWNRVGLVNVDCDIRILWLLSRFLIWFGWNESFVDINCGDELFMYNLMSFIGDDCFIFL